MEPIKIKDIVKACGGELFGDSSLADKYVKEISTSSNQIGENCLFIPLVGDKFDAHNFIGDAVENGCMCS